MEARGGMTAPGIQSQSGGSAGYLGVVQNFIDGRWRESEHKETFDVEDPSNGKVIAKEASATVRDAKAAVDAARSAFPSWRSTPPMARARIVLKAFQIAESRKEELSR